MYIPKFDKRDAQVHILGVKFTLKLQVSEIFTHKYIPKYVLILHTVDRLLYVSTLI
jgi:hypothetical protein